jgi:hypothetical protein
MAEEARESLMPKGLTPLTHFEGVYRSAGTACGKTSKLAAGALKTRGFKPRRASFSKTYGTAGKPCPFKTPTLRHPMGQCTTARLTLNTDLSWVFFGTLEVGVSEI